MPTGERLIVEMPGGGGIGDAFAREPERVAADVRKGYITAEAAVRDYGVAIGADMLPDAAETQRLRAARS